MRTITDLVFNRPVAIVQSKLDVIVRQVIMPRLDGSAPQALAVDPDKSDRKPYSVTPEGIATIDVDGTLVRKASGMNALSGLTAYEQLSAELDQATLDNDVRGMLLICDSPGGEVAGLFDLADQVYALRDQKPLYAAVSDSACSAAYAIASAAQRIFVTRTACVGSIGVVVCHVDQSGLDEMSGLKYTFIHAGARKVDGNPHEPLSDDAREIIEAEVDRIDGLLVQTVARNRGMKARSIRNLQAAIFFGEEGISAGLADELGTEDDAHDALVAAIQSAPFQGGSILGHASTGGRTSSASRSPGIVAACNRLAARMAGKTETPPAPRQTSGGLVKACLAMSQPMSVGAPPKSAGSGGRADNCIALGRRMRAEATQRSRPTEARSTSTRIEPSPRKARTGGLLKKCLAIRTRLEAEAGQKPADAPTGGLLAKTRAIAARMGASPRNTKLEEETYA